MTTLVQAYERQRKLLAETYVKQLKSLKQVVGTRPYASRRLKPEEQLADYLANRDSPEFWQGFIADERNGRTPDNRKLAAVAYALRMEKLFYEAVEVPNAEP